jgi:hypothetical protein
MVTLWWKTDSHNSDPTYMKRSTSLYHSYRWNCFKQWRHAYYNFNSMRSTVLNHTVCYTVRAGRPTGYRLDGRGVGVRVQVRARFFSSSRRPDRLRPAQPPIHWYRQLFPRGVKRLGREVHHLPPISSEVKHTWIYTSTPPNVFMA